MIISMTGFGRSVVKSSLGFIRVEIKTINHKYSEFTSRIPGYLNEYEDLMRRQIGREVKRGKISIYIACPDPVAASSKLVLNERLAKEVFQKIKRLEDILRLKISEKDSPSEKAIILKEVIHYPDVLTKEVAYDRRNLFSKDLEKSITLALQSLKQSRISEGRALEKDLMNRLGVIKKSLDAIGKRLPVVARDYKKSLQARMKEFIKGTGEMDHERLTIEVALFVKNTDISEEITRMRSHIDAMKKTMAESGELGRKIDFLGQEMYREANTMGAKSSDTMIAEQVIRVKGAIEKIREQAQNIE